MANNFKNAFATNVSINSASPTDVYTSATGGSGVNSILIELDIANTGNSAVSVTVLIRDNSATTSYHVIKGAPVPVGSTLKVVSGQKIVFAERYNTKMYLMKLRLIVILKHMNFV